MKFNPRCAKMEMEVKWISRDRDKVSLFGIQIMEPGSGLRRTCWFLNDCGKRCFQL